MHKNEIVLELTLCAIQNNLIEKQYYKATENNEIETANNFAAKQISDFYNALLENIKL